MRSIASSATVLAIAARALAQDVPPPAPDDDITVRIKAGAWFPRLGGSTRLAPSAASPDFTTDLPARDQEAVALAELAILKGDAWRLRFSGFDFSTSGAGAAPGATAFGTLSFAAGDPYRVDVDLSSFAIELGYDLFRPLDGTPAREQGADLRFAPFGVIRHADVDQVVEDGAGSVARADGEWAAAYVGLEMIFRHEPPGGLFFGRAVEISAGTAAGPALGGEGGTVWQVHVDLALEVAPGFAILGGYRLLELDVEADGYEFDAGLQGLFFGATISF